MFNDAEQDIVSAMGRAGLSIYDMAKQIEAGGKVGGEFTDQLLDALADRQDHRGRVRRDQREDREVRRLGGRRPRDGQAVERRPGRSERAARKRWLLQADPLSRFGDKWKILMEDMADGTIDTKEAADAANFLAEKLGKEVPEVLDIAGQAWDDNKAKVEEWRQATEEAIAESTQFVLDYAEAIEDAALQVAGAEGDMRDLADVFSQMGVKGDALAAIFDLQNPRWTSKPRCGTSSSRSTTCPPPPKGIDLSEGLDPSNVKADALLDAIDGLRPADPAAGHRRVLGRWAGGGEGAWRTSYITQVAERARDQRGQGGRTARHGATSKR